jgi:hypothetical protein
MGYERLELTRRTEYYLWLGNDRHHIRLTIRQWHGHLPQLLIETKFGGFY